MSLRPRLRQRERTARCDRRLASPLQLPSAPHRLRRSAPGLTPPRRRRQRHDQLHLVASCSDGIVGCCTLSAEDPEFWPDALKGEAAYLHKLAVRRTHAGRGVSSALIEACRHAARTQGCAKLRLDCHPNLRGLYERLGFTHVDTFNPGWDPTFIAERLELEI